MSIFTFVLGVIFGLVIPYYKDIAKAVNEKFTEDKY